MGISLKPEHLKRYKDLAGLFMKYGRADLVTKSGLEDLLPESEQTEDAIADPKAEELAKDLEEMGPIYIKIGQVLSSRPDLLPPSYISALTRLQDKLPPFSFGEVEKIVEAELGVRISKAFSEFDSTPIASASLGQVHRAVLRDGRPVAVKVQRPNIHEDLAKDLEALKELTDFADSKTDMGRRYHFGEMLEEFKENLARELDYKQEAKHLQTIAENLAEYENIVVPLPVEDYTTSRVLTMDYIRGKKITKITPLMQLELNGGELADELFKAYLQQTLVDGIFHADPHPGNVFVTDDGKVALLDLGMVGHVAPRMQESLLKLMIAMSEGRGDITSDLAIKIGEIIGDDKNEFNEPEFRRKVSKLVGKQQGANIQDFKIGLVMLQFSQICGDSGLRMPSELTMLSKTLLNLDEVGRTLDPNFNPTEAIQRHAADITRQRMWKSATPGNLLSSAMEAKEFAQELPGRINKILDLVAKNRIKLDVDAIDEATLVDGFQKVANRIATGLILAALIVGASLLMRVETSFRIFGYPGLAIIFFIIAAGLGLQLVFSIMAHDRHLKKSQQPTRVTS
jgi:predicted unusual protein kinase regulating ubiquinone biosynthesis (AarF/ABC1/UbiB family)